MLEATREAAGHSIQMTSKDEIITWILAANQFLHSQTEMVKKAFLVCGISNNLDGSENHLIRVQEKLPSFEIPYGVEHDDEDPFASSETGSSDDNDDGSESDGKDNDHMQ